MFDIAKRTGFGAVVLMVIPILAWVSGWQWHPDNEAWWWRVLLWMTQTVTAPWGFITSIILFGWFLWCLRFRRRPALVLAGILGAALLVGQGIKSAIKDHVQEPRPYIMWLEQTHDINGRDFYSLPGKARSMLVKKELQNEQQIPRWLRKHWQHDTGFAFPSGHTVFAASWSLLALGLLWPRRHFKSVVLIMVWSVAVLSSRMVLGMHWPRDVVVGVLLSWLIIALACWLVQHWIGPLTPNRMKRGISNPARNPARRPRGAGAPGRGGYQPAIDGGRGGGNLIDRPPWRPAADNAVKLSAGFPS